MADEKLANAVASGATTLAGGDLGCLLHLEGRAAVTGISLEFRHVAEVLADAHVAGHARDTAPDVGAGHARDTAAPVAPPQPSLNVHLGSEPG